MVGKGKTIEKLKEELGTLLSFPQVHSILHSKISTVKNGDVIYIVTLGEEIDEHLRDTLESLSKTFNVAIFEQLPLHKKIEVIKKHNIVFSRDELELNEYFYSIKKIWEDQEKRQDIEPEEVIKLIRKSGVKIEKTKKKMRELPTISQ